MSHAIYWTDEAHETFDAIVLIIEDKWGFKQAGVFVKRVQQILSLIAEQPYLFRASITHDLRQAIISKQTSMFYEVKENSINILFFWDNRQEPLFDL
ncbi:type II toxin-antitoxin system RelE/ParE family toxin [Mucilaginibacter rigui]|uniref:Type II toxin-antitoxin system RelE/ParE family toxin n=1 Tax=Mucilaginibacter rigui TaxID=534635 RepID=A0ABR7X4Z0_9SPHI|nr:type II toxin-antitoxin system RelE/ParE family toxin [Mucilaginibacter rigui]MBD1385649.1 type II toxin-antitoxin system RelE/ParE family toxin [Mucilaginibacter rigui]